MAWQQTARSIDRSLIIIINIEAVITKKNAYRHMVASKAMVAETSNTKNTNPDQVTTTRTRDPTLPTTGRVFIKVRAKMNLPTSKRAQILKF